MRSHVRSSHTIRIAAPPQRVFRFFTPAGEELWVEGWRPRYVRPADGATEEGMVFVTGDGVDLTIWQLADFDTQACRSRYVRTTPALRTGTVEVQCDAAGDGATDASITYDLTALTQEGAASLDAYRGDAFRQMIEGWGASIRDRLAELLAARIR